MSHHNEEKDTVFRHVHTDATGTWVCFVERREDGFYACEAQDEYLWQRGAWPVEFWDEAAWNGTGHSGPFSMVGDVTDTIECTEIESEELARMLEWPSDATRGGR